MNYQLIETATEDEFVQKSTAFLATAITQAVEARGQCLLGLSGGKTPKEIYGQLAQQMGIDWGRVHMFLIDERCVPTEHPDSNRHLLNTTLLRYGQIDVNERCTFPDPSLDPKACADDYDQKLRALFAEKGEADILVLGVGEDGHTASLFPPVPQEAFGERFAIHTTTDRFAVHDRVTMTVKPMHAARAQCFFVSGDAKKKTWTDMMASEEGPKRWPAKAIMAFGETTVISRW